MVLSVTIEVYTYPMLGYDMGLCVLQRRTSGSVCSVRTQSKLPLGVQFATVRLKVFTAWRAWGAACLEPQLLQAASRWPPRLVLSIACKPTWAACSGWSHARLPLGVLSDPPGGSRASPVRSLQSLRVTERRLIKRKQTILA